MESIRSNQEELRNHSRSPAAKPGRKDYTMKMQRILVNGKSTAIEDFLRLFTDEEGEIDFDLLGSLLDSDFLDKAIDSFSSSYDMFELIERYLQCADSPIVYDTKEA